MIRTPTITLIEQWMPLAKGLARRWAERFPWLRDELESAAVYALWRVAEKAAAQDRTPEQNERFPGLVRKGAFWGIIRVVNQERKRNPRAFAPQIAATNAKGHTVTLLDLAGEELASSDREPGWELEAVDEVCALMDEAELSPRYRETALRVLGRGEPARVLAGEQGVTPARVQQLVRNAVTKMKAAAEERDGVTVA